MADQGADISSEYDFSNIDIGSSGSSFDSTVDSIYTDIGKTDSNGAGMSMGYMGSGSTTMGAPASSPQNDCSIL